MPNWCGGNIRFRGKKEDIIKLLENEIKYCRHATKDGETEVNPVKVFVDEYDELKISPAIEDRNGWFWINDSQRAFLEAVDTIIFDQGFYPYIYDENGEWILTLEGFRQVWSIHSEDYVEMSKKYNVDIRIFGWERGMCFSQEVEIIKGDVTKDIFEDYNHGKDWMWDCPMPYLGG